jgi:hypothetical protein
MSADLEELILGCVLDAESPAVNSSAATLIEGSGLREIASIDEDGVDSPPREGGYAIFVLGT